MVSDSGLASRSRSIGRDDRVIRCSDEQSRHGDGGQRIVDNRVAIQIGHQVGEMTVLGDEVFGQVAHGLVSFESRRCRTLGPAAVLKSQ